ncbi:putative metal-dependent hydrolase [Mycoplasmopsis canis PG 14]|uniref:YgjP-like metallopeptidase domain-containing protein n=1 Tax=Mycoplasmopsis canis TaxID=29555 RepID=UPI00025AE9AA|nr:YgjP-like metallopeptidase domain-containing protein [Mycoplasmopsis canis]AMD81082.1 metal-dependent hydrolase [Mycoplasmopsis canis PG 14]EIE39856.1 putative metal-dependent hydrolase [Mycoplasmopsis canis PG 14]
MEYQIIKIDDYDVKHIIHEPKYSRTSIFIKKGILNIYPTKEAVENNEISEKIKKFFYKNKDLYLNYAPHWIDFENKYFYYLGEKIPFTTIKIEKSFLLACTKIGVFSKTFRSQTGIEKFIKDYLNNKFLEYLKIRVKEVENMLGDRINHPVSVDTSYRYAYAKHYYSSLYGCKKIVFKYSMFPFSKEIIDSIIFHELTHCKHKNHKKAFWKTLFSYYPEEKYKYFKKKLDLNIYT